MAESVRNQPMAGPEPVGGPSAPAKNGSTVLIACRIPQGLELRTFDIVEDDEAAPTGIRRVRKAVQRQGPNSSFTVRGPGRGMLTGLTPDQIDSVQPSGFAVTQGCPADLWQRWVTDNQLAPYVIRGDIFSETSMERLRNHASELARNAEEALTGLEPIDGDNPGRRVRGERGLRLMRGDNRADR